MDVSSVFQPLFYALLTMEQHGGTECGIRIDMLA